MLKLKKMSFTSFQIKEKARAVSYTHLRAHETDSYLVCRLLLEKKANKGNTNEKGLDTFFRFSKDYHSGISVGYNFSHERYETFESRIFQKSGGQTFEKNISIIDSGFFHTIHLGYIF